MRYLTHGLAALSLVALVAAAPVQTETQNVRAMAGILAKLNHFPTDAEKKTLETIVKSDAATAHEKTIAQALMNTQHAVGAADKPKLEAVTKDQAAPQAVRTLAEILARLNHSPSAADKATLSKLAGGN